MLRKLITRAMFVLAICTFSGALFVFGTISVSAEPLNARGVDFPQRQRTHDEWLVDALRLPAQQATAVKNLLSAERTAMRAIDESTHPQRDAIHAENRIKLADVLTPEQLLRHDEWRKASRPPRLENAAGPQVDGAENSRRNPT